MGRGAHGAEAWVRAAAHSACIWPRTASHHNYHPFGPRSRVGPTSIGSSQLSGSQARGWVPPPLSLGSALGLWPVPLSFRIGRGHVGHVPALCPVHLLPLAVPLPWGGRHLMQINGLDKWGLVGVQNLTEKSWLSPVSTEEQILREKLGSRWGGGGGGLEGMVPQPICATFLPP